MALDLIIVGGGIVGLAANRVKLMLRSREFVTKG